MLSGTRGPQFMLSGTRGAELKLHRGDHFEVSIPAYKRIVAGWHTSARLGLQNGNKF